MPSFSLRWIKAKYGDGLLYIELSQTALHYIPGADTPPTRF